MSIEMGRREFRGWPSRKPVWTISAIVFGVVVFAAAAYQQYEQRWTYLQKEYLRTYVWTGTSPAQNSKSPVLYRIDGKGRRPAVNADLSDPDVWQNKAKLEWRRDRYDNKKLHAWLQAAIYEGRSPWETLGDVWWVGLLGCGLGLVLAVPKDRERARRRKYGRRLRGPELVTPEEFNRRNNSDGVFIIGESPRGWWVGVKRLFGVSTPAPIVRIPRSREASHLLILGDTGTGKGMVVRQLLCQIQARGETAIVYDPHLEYTPENYDPERGDVILNPLDERMPYWAPGSELRHDAEAATLAKSLFPDKRGQENRFFTETPRKIFAYLLTLRPSVEELTRWLCNPLEIDRRVQGTELAAMIDPTAPSQRAGVLSSLNLVADALKLLPPKSETKTNWTAAEWSQHRRGWIFLTSTPETRDPLLPLTSFWLDLLVLRLMTLGVTNPGAGASSGPPVWFVLDELSSLQRLPQLHTAITENRKTGNPVVLSFHGRSQLEGRYGDDAESMLSQPATKVFLRTGEPNAAKWISQTIGEVEFERIRESRTDGRFPSNNRHSKNDMLDRTVEDLVMASQISGLPDLRGYVKSGNLVVPMSVQYLELPKRHPGLVERRSKPREEPEPPEPAASEPKREAVYVPSVPAVTAEQTPFFE